MWRSRATRGPLEAVPGGTFEILPYDTSRDGGDRILYGSCFCSMACFARGNLTFKHKCVSSTVGAPCNEESLCNRAGWLGMGYVEHTVARDGLLPQSGRVFRNRSVSPCRCIFAASPM